MMKMPIVLHGACVITICNGGCTPEVVVHVCHKSHDEMSTQQIVSP